MPIDLQPFCATEADDREHLWKPWKDGDWVYATNGHIACRVPAANRPDITARPDKAPDAAAQFARALAREGNFLVMPPVPPLPKCLECDGTGRVRAIKCTDCKDGEFQHGHYTYECKNCENSAAGPGWEQLFDDAHAKQPHEVQRPCQPCDARGYVLKGKAMLMGEALYSPAYLALFAALPQARIRPGDKADTPKAIAALVLFDGGQGLVMPRFA
jgi:hypothetical protein